jgi:hypothetical protein
MLQYDEQIVFKRGQKLDPNIYSKNVARLGVEHTWAQCMTSHDEAKQYPDNPRVILLVQNATLGSWHLNPKPSTLLLYMVFDLLLMLVAHCKQIILPVYNRRRKTTGRAKPPAELLAGQCAISFRTSRRSFSKSVYPAWVMRKYHHKYIVCTFCVHFDGSWPNFKSLPPTNTVSDKYEICRG